MEFKEDFLSCLRNFINKEDEIYSDFSVEVEGFIFPCHRFVLGSCSPFFQALFRSDMQETRNNSVKLKKMSMETFKLIYEFLYLHQNGLNEDNFLDVWRAADFLQIDFIVSACLKIAEVTINEENCHIYLANANSLNRNVMDKILQYIKCSFDTFKDSESIMELDGENLLSVVRDFDLNTSREENVVNTVLKWVGHCKDNKCVLETTSSNTNIKETGTSRHAVFKTVVDGSLRSNYLAPLLYATRLTSLKSDFLTQLCHDQKIKEDRIAHDLVMSASLYRTGTETNYWPTFACHRRSSQWEDVVMMSGFLGHISIFNLNERKFTDIEHCHQMRCPSVLNVHKGRVYSCGYTSRNEDSLSMFVLNHGTWSKVTNIHYRDARQAHGEVFEPLLQKLFSFSLENEIFVVQAKTRRIFSWDPRDGSDLCHLTSVPSGMPVIYSTIYKSLIFAICCSPNNSAVLNIYDTVRHEWKAAVNLEGMRAQEMSSFQKGDSLYFMTSDARLYVLEHVGGGFSLSHVATFPSIRCKVFGAVAYGEDLFLFVRESMFHPTRKTYHKSLDFPELFNTVHVIGVIEPSTPILSTSVLKGSLKLDKF